MVYCTLVYGEELHDLHSKELDKFSETHDLIVLTNLPQYFLNAETILYERNEFSY